TKTLKRAGSVRSRQARVRRRERRIFRDDLLVKTGGLKGWIPVALIGQSACAQVKIVRFGASFVPAPAPPELEAQIVHNSARDVFLDGEKVRQPPFIGA